MLSGSACLGLGTDQDLVDIDILGLGDDIGDGACDRVGGERHRSGVGQALPGRRIGDLVEQLGPGRARRDDRHADAVVRDFLAQAFRDDAYRMPGRRVHGRTGVDAMPRDRWIEMIWPPCCAFMRGRTAAIA